MHEPFTPAWADALCDAINDSVAYRHSARRWTWPVALVVDAEPDAGISGAAIQLDLDRGHCDAAAVVPTDGVTADYVLRGDSGTWKEIIVGDLDPLNALLRGRLRLVRGSLSRLALNAASARALARCAASVPTRFPEPASTAPASGAAVGGPPPGAAAVVSPAPPTEAPADGSLDGAAQPGRGRGQPVRQARHGGGAFPETPPASPAPPAPPTPAVDDAGSGHAYLRLFRSAGRLAWDPDAVDLEQDREDWARIRREHEAEQYGEQIHRLCSLFYEGEESVARTLSPFLGAMSRAGLGTDRELHLAAQVYEEARHFAFFRRYFAEVLGDTATDRHMTAAPRAVLVDDLDDVASRIRREEDPARLRALLVEGVTHYMGVVEAMLARTGYRGAAQALAERGWLPGLQEGFRLIRRDEGRHVAFGIHFIADAVADEPRHAAIVEATFERHLPHVLQTVAAFDFPEPLVDIADLQAFALGAHRQFMAAAGLDEGAPGDLQEELAEA